MWEKSLFNLRNFLAKSKFSRMNKETLNEELKDLPVWHSTYGIPHLSRPFLSTLYL